MTLQAYEIRCILYILGIVYKYVFNRVYMCHPTVPSITVNWLFSRPWSGLGGSGGGVFTGSTAPADVRWQEKKTQRSVRDLIS